MFKKIPFAGGTYCEVWAGEWKKGGRGEGAGEEVSGKKAEVEKVSLSLSAPIPLIRLFVGCLESASAAQDTREGTQGSTFPHCSLPVYSSVLLRPSET